MAQTLGQLFSTLHIADGTLILDESNVGEKVTSYLDIFLERQTIAIEEVVLQPPDAETIIITGKSAFLGGTPLEVTVTLTLDNFRRPDLELTATPVGEYWRITDTFTDLVDGYLDYQVVQEATFHISTRGYDLKGDGRDFDYLVTDKDLNPIAKTQANLLGNDCALTLSAESVLIPAGILDTHSETFHFNGKFSFIDGLPRLYLTADETLSLSFGAQKIPLNLHLTTFQSGSEAIRSGLEVSTTFDFDESSARLSTVLPRVGGYYMLEGEFENVGLSSLESLTDRLGLDGFQEIIPSGFLSTDAIRLSSFSIGIIDKRVDCISLGIGIQNVQLIPGIDLTALEEVNLTFFFMNPFQRDQRRIDLTIQGKVNIVGVSFNVFTRASAPFFKGYLAEGEIIQTDQVVETLLSPLGIVWPEGVPEFDITNAELAIIDADGTYFTRFDAGEDFTCDFGGMSVTLQNLGLSLSRELAETGTGKVNKVGFYFTAAIGPVFIDLYARVSSDGTDVFFFGEAELDDPLKLTDLVNDLLPDDFDIPEEFLDIEVSRVILNIDLQNNAYSLVLTTETAVGLGDLATLQTRRVALEYAKPTPNAPADWSFSLDGHLDIADLCTLDGTLTAQRQSGTTMLSFVPVPDTAELSLPIPLPENNGKAVEVALNIGSVSMSKTQGTQPGGWSFSLITAARFENMYATLADAVPETVNATLHVDQTAMSLTIDRLADAFSLSLPTIFVPGGGSLSLGDMAFDASNFALVLGQQPRLAVDIGLGLPAPLNKVFGTDKSGNPNVELFRTYDPKNPAESMVRIYLTGDRDGVKAILRNSPLRTGEIVQEEGRSWLYCDMGEYGKVRFVVPELSYNETARSFACSGGFEIVRPLKLPLTLIQNLFTACGLGAVADLLPDTVDLKEVRVLDEQGSLNTSELEALWGGPGKLPKEVQSCLDILKKRSRELPNRLQDYLHIELPESLLFDFGLSFNGRVYVKAKVLPSDDPIKFLYPGMMPTLVGSMPGLYGIELSSLSLGTLQSGALFTLEVDGAVDQFDIATMAAALALPTDQLKFLPDSNDLQRKIILDNLFMIIVYQSVIPIPIPVFYDEVGLETLGFEGMTMQSHFRFPAPSGDLGPLFSAMTRFFSDGDYLLEGGKSPGGVELKYTIGPNYVTLPKYLGGVTLGKTTDVGTIDVFQQVAHLLNFLKTFRINELIQAFPLEQRIGAVNVNFFGMALKAAWVVSTPQEFFETAYKQVGLRGPDRQAALDILPASSGSTDNGLVVFMSGGLKVAGIAEFSALIGMLAPGATGFGTGFKFEGTLAGCIQMKVGGAVVVDPSNKMPLGLQGMAALTILKQEVLSGSVSLKNDGLFIDGNLNLFPTTKSLDVSARVKGVFSKDKLLLEGTPRIEVGGLKLAGSKATVDHNGVTLKATLLAQTVTLKAVENQGALRLEGSMAAVRVPGVFSLTDATRKRGPGASIQVSGSRVPQVCITGQASLLGLGGGVQGKITQAGFSGNVSGTVGAADGNLAFVYKNAASFTARGSFKCGIKMSVGPIKRGAVPVLPKINLNTKFNATMTVAVTSKGFTLTLDGDFRYGGKTFDVPKITLKTKPSSLAKLPVKVVKQIDDNVEKIFKSLIDDASKAAKKAAKKTGKKIKKTGKKIGKAIGL